MASEPTYKVTFSGGVLNGMPEKLVAQRFARVFKLNDDEIKQIFSGGIVTIKRGLDYEQADHYRNVLEKIGADCMIEPDSSVFVAHTEPDKEYERKKRRQMAELNQDFSNIGLVEPK